MAVTLITGSQKRKFGTSMSTAFHASGTGVNSGAAAVRLFAAVAGKRHWITQVEMVNKTAGEYPVCELVENEGATPLIRATIIPHSPGGSAGMGSVVVNFDPPIEVTAGTSFGWQHQSATGHTYASCRGYVED